MEIAERLGMLQDLARRVGWQAGDILLQVQRSGFDVQGSAESPVTTADLAANHHILTQLQQQLGTADFAYLTEETFKADAAIERRSTPWVWIIDPLDGTKDFINQTGEFAVHIALTYQGRPIVAVVACPSLGKLYSAVAGRGAFVEDRQGHRSLVRVSSKSALEEMILVASRNHRGIRLERLLDQLPIQSQTEIGSIGCKVAAIVEQQADLYLSLSGKSAPKDWDFAAPDLVLTEAGGQLTHFDQTPLIYNQADVNQWGAIIASNGISHSQLCQQLSEQLAEIDRTPDESP